MFKKLMKKISVNIIIINFLSKQNNNTILVLFKNLAYFKIIIMQLFIFIIKRFFF